MIKKRLDQELVGRGLATTRSQAESTIKLKNVIVNGSPVTKPGTIVHEMDEIKLLSTEQYVSRAGLKLASVAAILKLNFTNKIVLDVGSSTGGFTDYALQHGAAKVIAVDIGTEQLHPSLRLDPRVELHEKTDILDVVTKAMAERGHIATTVQPADIAVADVSFVSLRQLLPHISCLLSPGAQVVAMVKPQFEAAQSNLKHKGVIKNDKMRRDILKDFEIWCQKYFVITDKADSDVAGAKGNRERFYLLRKINS